MGVACDHLRNGLLLFPIVWRALRLNRGSPSSLPTMELINPAVSVLQLEILAQVEGSGSEWYLSCRDGFSDIQQRTNGIS